MRIHFRSPWALITAITLTGTLLASPASASSTLADSVAAAVGSKAATVATQREDSGWAFGTAVLKAKPDGYPQGWLFLAHREGRQWTVALDTGSGFTALAAQAPESVFSAPEKAVFASRVSIQATSSNNTRLRLPYAIGQTWTLTGGPHGWGGSEHPFSSIDLSGGDGIVRAAGAGTMYTMCADNSGAGAFPGGWRRVYHSNGYTTDYYHMRYLTSIGSGSSIGEGTALGNTGVNVCAGGHASGPHVHFGILDGTTRVGWHWRSAGKWVFWEGASAYGGYALHGSTHVNPGGGLYNYGALGSNQGIVDAWDSATVNRRSGPGTNYSIVGSVTDGTTVTISCWRNGTTHTGRYGTTAVWDKLTDGSWVSDAFVYTGVNTIGPNC
jgi:LasA protease